MSRHRPFGGIILGSLLVLVGLLLLLRTFGIIDMSLWQGIATYWPLGLVLAGIALLFRTGWLATIFIVATVVVGGIYLAGHLAAGEQRMIVQGVPSPGGISEVNMTISYGAGQLSVAKGSPEFLYRNEIQTSDRKAPFLDSMLTTTFASIRVQRQSTAGFLHTRADRWDIGLSPDPVYTLTAHYGAADASFDLRGINVATLDLESGAASTKVIFGEYPTAASINTGASSVSLSFPKGANAEITVKGGVLDTTLDGFVKKGDSYYSEGYNASVPATDVAIEGGVSSISSSWY